MKRQIFHNYYILERIKVGLFYIRTYSSETNENFEVMRSIGGITLCLNLFYS